MAADGTSDGMRREELRAALSLGAIFSLRMLGLFMIYPVFAVYAEGLRGHTRFTVGLALGIYGLAQAVMQSPLGMLSDRVGRRPVIAAGLLVFAVGSVLAAVAETIHGVIAGRLLQGAGAVGSTLLALAADLTRDEQRTKTMAIMGIAIGASFVLAMGLSPLLDMAIGVPGIFWLTGGLAAVGVAVLFAVVPRAPAVAAEAETLSTGALYRRVLRNRELLRLDFGILAQHLVLTAGFVVLPLSLRDAGLGRSEQWVFYLPVLGASVGGMIPLLSLAERGRWLRPVFLGSIGVIVATQGVLAATDRLVVIGVAMGAFFSVFNTMEALLPSLVSKSAPAGTKGTATGVYSTAQFLGIFLGGTLGGWLYGAAGAPAVFAVCGGTALLWLAVSVGLRPPRSLSDRTVTIGPSDGTSAREVERRLTDVPGIADATLVESEGFAYLKVDRSSLDEEGLQRLLRRVRERRAP